MQVNQTAELLQLESSENLQDLAKAMGKLLIVSLVWSGTDLLNKNVPTTVDRRDARPTFSGKTRSII